MVTKWTTLLWLLATTITSGLSYQIMFEQFKQCTSNGVFECNLRVRKINRTTAALNGNMTVLTDLGNNFNTWIDAYHSPLGNNQYNLYPMKIPSIGVCEFLDKFWGDYYPYIVEYAPNVAKPGACPLSVRVVQINDMMLDKRMLPPYVPNGLWKVVWQAKEEASGKNFVFEFTAKVYPDEQ